MTVRRGHYRALPTVRHIAPPATIGHGVQPSDEVLVHVDTRPPSFHASVNRLSVTGHDTCGHACVTPIACHTLTRSHGAYRANLARKAK